MNNTIIKDYAKINKVPIALDDTLSFLLKTINNNKFEEILEIGTAIGYSAINMANLDNVKHIDTLEIDPDRAKIAQININNEKLSEKIKIYLLDAKLFLENSKKTYDFIFLDGPKGQYINYIDYCLQILNIGGIIFVDNIYFKGMVNGKIPVSKGVRSLVRHLQEFLTYIYTIDGIEVNEFDIGDGVCIIKKIK